ncbi:MAG: hypothetical protein GX856_06560 [Gammaproteobacteria bacterium]|nr:hypothetical protein [Gammaproteobacteria bacterium]
MQSPDKVSPPRPAPIDFARLPDCALVRRRDLLAPYGPVPFSSMTLHRRVKAGAFPAPVRLEGMNAWRWGDVRDWLDSAADRGAA